MSLRTNLALLVLTTAVAASAASVTFVGPTPAKPGSLIIGDPLEYEVFGATLTQPTAGDPNWNLTIRTNYGDPTKNLISGSPAIIPPFLYGDGSGPFTIGDFLILWNGNNYGVALTSHDGYAAGNLYRAGPAGYLTSGQIMDNPNPPFDKHSPNPSHNVLLAPGGTLLGTGILSGSQTGDGATAAKYTLVIQFSAPANFLGTGDFSIDFSSYACANGILMGTGTFTGGGGGDIPEPSTLFLSVPVLLAGFHFARKHRRRAA